MKFPVKIGGLVMVWSHLHRFAAYFCAADTRKIFAATMCNIVAAMKPLVIFEFISFSFFCFFFRTVCYRFASSLALARSSQPHLRWS